MYLTPKQTTDLIVEAEKFLLHSPPDSESYEELQSLAYDFAKLVLDSHEYIIKLLDEKE